MILKSRLTADTDVSRFIARTASYSIYGLLGMSLLGTIGIDTSPVLAGIGVTGFTLGFALKEIATNLLSGVFLVMSKPFEKGQWVKVLAQGGKDGLEGQVISIDSRHVSLRNKAGGLSGKEDSILMIPSVLVCTNPLIVAKGPFHSVPTATTNK